MNLEKILDCLIDDLSKYPDLHNGFCGLVATTIAKQLQHHNINYSFIFLKENDKDFENFYEELKDQKQIYPDFEKDYLNNNFFHNEKYQDFNFSHIILEISFNNKKTYFDGRNITDEINDFSEFDSKEYLICTKTNSIPLMENMLLHNDFWNDFYKNNYLKNKIIDDINNSFYSELIDINQQNKFKFIKHKF